MKPLLSALVLAILCLLTTGCQYPVTTGHARATTPIAIPSGNLAYYGVHLDWSVDSPSAYVSRLGKAPSVYGEFIAFPLTSASKNALSQKVDQIVLVHGKLMLTLQTMGGLNTVTTSAINNLVAVLANYNARGVAVFIRFDQEMNGSWYPWGQQPIAYITAFRRIATAIHLGAPQSAMVWAPNYGGGYPFTGGHYNPQPGSTNFKALDTNHDGVLTMSDDPYAPYYPGDSYADWIGFTDYHWGNVYPWGKNEVPEAGKFVAQLTGNYNGLNGDERAIPDFYATYAVGHNKPFVLTETSALYTPGRSDGASNFAIKIAWANQVFAANLTKQFPHIKMILWFELLKGEKETRSSLDWRLTYDPVILARFKTLLPGWLVFSQ